MTWSADPSVFWPRWIGEDFPDWRVCCVSYPAFLTDWRGEAMHLPDRATNLLDLLYLHGLGSRPICFVAHSMGGLVVAQMLRNATTYGRQYRDIGAAVQGLVFLATPLQGSFWADVCERAKFIVRPSNAMDDLKRHHPYVTDLGRWFREYLDTHPEVECAFYCEARRTSGITVVDMASADPGLPRILVVPLDEDHISIAKPKERTAHIYRGVCQVLVSLHSRVPQGGGAGRGATQSESQAATGAMRRVAEAVRTTLEPHVLPRIARAGLHDSIFSPILASLGSKAPRIVAIVGPAGVGKSVMLGRVYDSLRAAGAAWVAIVRCGDVQAALRQPEQLANAFGSVATGAARSIVDVAGEAGRQLGKGAVLIDTLDAILAPLLVPWLRQVFEGLVAAAVTVVFTCREHEYELLEPLQNHFPGLSPVMDRRGVPVFAYPTEVGEATRCFVRSRPDIDEQRGEAFVEGVMGLAADSVRLQEITQSPLLLALLCDLFGSEGYVPPDLTVSQLWERFWNEKVARGRQPGAPLQLGREKEKLAIELARTLFAQSDESVCLSIYEIDVELPATRIASEAWNELLSEGVIKREAPSGRVRFFHQTLLEYAMARYLTGIRGKADLENLLERAARAPLGGRGLHLWPILRQVLAIADTPDCNRCLAALDRKTLPAFRAAAFAITSRSEPALLSHVCAWAVEAGTVYQKEFLLALDGAAGPLAPAAFDAALSVLRNGDPSIASAAADAAANLIVRWGSRLPERRVDDVIDAIRGSSPNAAEVNTLLGRLLRALVETPKPRNRQELLTLRSSYATLPATIRHQVIKLHLAPGVEAAERAELLPFATALPLGGSDERDDALALVTQTLSVDELLERLFASDLQRTWIGVFAAAVGRTALHNDALAKGLIDGLCAPDGFVPARASQALVEAIHAGAAEAVLDRLCTAPRL